MRKTLLYCTVAMTLLAACSGSGLFEKEKKYTPLYVYYNPLAQIFPVMDTDFPESDYPDFINYPNDRVKHGLRNNVSLVRYAFYNNNGGAEYLFDTEGKLKQVSSFLDKARKHIELREFRYDDAGRLVGVYRNSHKDKWASNRQKFEYDTAGRLVRREGGMLWAHQIYSYYETGILKDITPQYFNDFYSDTKGKMEFNESGNLVRMEAHMTSNPFMSAAAGRYDGLPNICTYTYTDGLCTEKLERIVSKKDTIVCRNLYTYNDKGDLTSWEYSGGLYQTNPKDRNRYVFSNIIDLKIAFEYEYDNHDNWTTMRVILPENYDQLKYLKRYYAAYLTFIEGKKRIDPNEKPIMTYHRHIEYQAFSAEEERELKKKDAPKFTAVQGYGLYGDVKSVSDSRFVILFDEYGNITKRTWIDYEETNEFSYESSTRYMRSGVGPFRITCEGNLRKEEDEGKIMGTEEYEFDKKGRVVRHDYADANGMCPINETYTYNGREKFPVTMIYKYSYEEGQDVATCMYTYIETDKQGNWTKRKVNRTWECVEYFFDGEKDTSRTMTKTDPEFTETRTISYY